MTLQSYSNQTAAPLPVANVSSFCPPPITFSSSFISIPLVPNLILSARVDVGGPLSLS